MIHMDKLEIKLFIVITVLIILSLIDLVCTIVVLGHGGVELNPIILFVMNKFGYMGLAYIKSLTIALLLSLILIEKFKETILQRKYIFNLLMFVTFSYLTVVIYHIINLIVLRC